MAEDINALIEKHALANAFSHGGKAQPGSIIGKLIADNPKYREQMKELAPKIAKLVFEVNKLTIKQQEEKLLKIFPEFFEKKVHEEKKDLPELPGAKMGKVVTRFAPYPSGALHIGNLKPALISYMYAKKYDGKFIIRIEDTNPEKMKPEYIKYIGEDLDALGLKPDIPIYKVSDHFDYYIDLAKKLVKEAKAYVCTCSTVGQKKGRLASIKTECKCRKLPTKEHEARFADMISGKYKEHAAILRLKTNINDPNPALRDPTLYKISDIPHAVTGKKYHVYPMYNFQCAIEDHDYDITHVFRAVEHTANTEIQKKIFDAFGWKNFPNVVNFGFLYLIGTNIHKRYIREGFDKGIYKSWDDIVLGEQCGIVRALLRRGIQRHTFEHLVIELGVSPNVARISWDMIYSINRKLIDPIAHRYSFVAEPVELNIKNAPNVKEIEVKLHPDSDKEFKKIKVNNSVYVWGKDFNRFKGQEVRLMHLYNIKLNPKAEFTSKENKQIPRIQWVPTDFAVKTEVLMPTGDVEKGFAEKNVENLKVGDIIQFERFGFVKLEKKGKDKFIFCYTHG